MPVLARVAGFEWGTGFYINPISPEESIQSLKSVCIFPVQQSADVRGQDQAYFTKVMSGRA